MSDLERALGPAPENMGGPLHDEVATAQAHIWPFTVPAVTGARPAALEAKSACSFCVGLNGEHVKNCLRPDPEKRRVTDD